MFASMRDALKKFFVGEAKELPGKTQSKSQKTNNEELHPTQKLEPNPSSRRGGRNSGRLPPQRSNANPPVVSSLSTSPSFVGALEVQTLSIQPSSRTYELKVIDGVRPKCLLHDEPDDYLYVAPVKMGTKNQAHKGSWHDEREVVIGLDFGTSSVKVIIGDRALEKAYAVPFNKAQGIRRYLLPSRLYENGSCFSLTEADQLYRDLKLSLLAHPSDAKVQLLAAAFLALVIRHACGWLLSEHHDVYHRTNIQWKLVLGVPAAHHLQVGNQELFHKVAQGAWLAAASPQPVIRSESIVDALSRASELIGGAVPAHPLEEADIKIVPEIAAQIYGYVASNRFDLGAKNLYLMVDVGAGTIDSSLFQVTQGKGGRFGFSFYTSQVQPNGVMNLHRHRLKWWAEALESLHSNVIPKFSELMESKRATDRIHSIPESFADYFSDIHVQYRDGSNDPDQYFFKEKVMAQVRVQSMWRVWKDNLLTQQDLNGIPMFLCGGGTRMRFYRNLEQEMKRMPNCSWLKTATRPLVKPKMLVAPGLPIQEYDRLSVAFGLSFLEVSEVIKATPIPLILPDTVTTWRDNYIDKDQC